MDPQAQLRGKILWNSLSEHRLINDTNLSPLAYRDYRFYWIGRVISTSGTQMQLVALAWHVHDLTHNPLALGFLGLARALAVMFTALFGGVLADSVDRRRLLLITQTLLLMVSASLTIITFTSLARPWMLYTAAALGGVLFAIDTPARQAMLANLVPPTVLPRALSLDISSFQVAHILGPSLGGVLIAVSGPGTVYAIDSLSFLAMLGALLAISYRTVPTGPRQMPLSAAWEGFLFLRTMPVLWSTMWLDFLATFFGGSLLLLPIFAESIFRVGPIGLGFLFAAPSVGALVVAIILSRTEIRHHQGAGILLSIAGYGLAVAGFGLAQNVFLGWLCLAASGGLDAVSTVLRQTLRQVMTPDRLRGRMTSINMIFFAGGPQLGEFEAGALARFTSPRFSVVIGGLGSIAVAAAFALLHPALRRFDRATPPTDKAIT